ncbi:MAG TPA: hypothetical protein DEF51_43775, partial [Myxococcales bacterium]|nr:hypothetical protein [Myxococcales bacterium]
VYSLGVMVYEMVTGSLPFTAATPWEWATKHLTAQPAPLDAHPAGQALPHNKKQAVMRALAKNRDERQDGVLAFLQEFTGYQDADSAWTMATSAGGGIVPKSQPGVARGPAPTPGPMPQTGFGQAATPPPGYASQPGMHSQPGQHGYGSQPGMHSQPGMSPAPGGYGGYGSSPSMGGASYPGYSTGAQPKSGGILGKLVAVAVIGLFVLVGAGGGLAWWMMQDDDPEPVATNNNTTQTGTTGTTGTTPVDPNATPMVPTSPMQPLQPNQPQQ